MADADGYPPEDTPYGTMHYLVRDRSGHQREWAVAEWMEPNLWRTQEWQMRADSLVGAGWRYYGILPPHAQP